MEPEEIDKLFKNRLAGLPATPSPDAWLRLQQKMEPPKKERTMWVYYVAASISILLISGLLFFRTYNSTNTIQVAQEKNYPAPKKNIFDIDKTQATSAPAVASTSKDINKLGDAGKSNQEKVTTIAKQAEESNKVKPEPVFATVTKVKAAPSKQKRKILMMDPVAKPIEEQAPVVAQTDKSFFQNEDLKNTFAQNNANTANTSVVQVVVKKSSPQEEISDENEEIDLRESLSRKGALLKNIYLQAKNLKNGDPVELATLGLDTEKINSEKENIKHKINKVISL